MDTYSFLRELADSWILLAMCVFYVAAIVWVFRPGSRELYEDISDIPFRNDTLPSDARVDQTSPEAR